VRQNQKRRDRRAQQGDQGRVTSMSKTTSSVQTSDLGEDERPTKRVKVELKVEVEDKVIVSKLI
jgi:hypothetical protein